MKRCSLAFALLTSVIATSCYAGGPDYLVHADEMAGYPGYYLGGQLGWAQYGIKDSVDGSTSFDTHVKDVFVGRFFVGYKFVPFFAVELGAAYFGNYRYSTFYSGHDAIDYNRSISRQLYGIDLMGRFIINANKFYLTFAGGGSAIVTKYYNPYIAHETFAMPKVEAGVGVNLTQYVALGVSYAWLFGNGSFSPSFSSERTEHVHFNRRYIPSIQMATVNLTVNL